MPQFLRAAAFSFLAIASYECCNWLMVGPPPQVPCRCGSAPVESAVILPTMVVRS